MEMTGHRNLFYPPYHRCLNLYLSIYLNVVMKQVYRASRNSNGEKKKTWNVTFATTRRPLVPLSNRCTMPGRITGAGPDHIATMLPGVSSSSLSSSSSSDLWGGSWRAALAYRMAGSPQWWSSAFTSVPSEWPGPGCTTCLAPVHSRNRKWEKNKCSKHFTWHHQESQNNGKPLQQHTLGMFRCIETRDILHTYHVGRLVNDQEVLILIFDIQWDIFRFCIHWLL